MGHRAEGTERRQIHGQGPGLERLPALSRRLPNPTSRPPAPLARGRQGRRGPPARHFLGAVSFGEYVEKKWLPTKHIEASTRAAYVSNLEALLPVLGRGQMGKVTRDHSSTGSRRPAPTASPLGRSASTSSEPHATGSSSPTPCDHTELSGNCLQVTHLTPEESRQLNALIWATPPLHRPMVETVIETGARWGELIALPARHVGFLRRGVTVEETIVEVLPEAFPHRGAVHREAVPEGHRTSNVWCPPGLAERRRRTHQGARTRSRRLALPDRGRDTHLRGTRTRVWLPAGKASGVDFDARMHNLRHALAC